MEPFASIQLGERETKNDKEEIDEGKENGNEHNNEPEKEDTVIEKKFSMMDIKSLDSLIKLLEAEIPKATEDLAGSQQRPEGCIISQETQASVASILSRMSQCIELTTELLADYQIIRSKKEEQEKKLIGMEDKFKKLEEGALLAEISKNNAETNAEKAEKARIANMASYMALLRQVEEQKLDINKLKSKDNENEMESKHKNITHLRETMELKHRVEQLELELKTTKEAASSAADREAAAQQKLKTVTEQKSIIQKQLSTINAQFIEYSQKAERRIKQMKRLCSTSNNSFSFDVSSPYGLEMTSSRADLIPNGFSNGVSGSSIMSSFNGDVNSTVRKRNAYDIHSVDELEASDTAVGRVVKSIASQPVKSISPSPPTPGQRFLGTFSEESWDKKSLPESSLSTSSNNNNTITPELMSARMRRLRSIRFSGSIDKQ